MLRENLYYLQSLGQKDMPVENMLAVRQAYEPEKLLDAFLRESERCYYTSLSFPSRVADSSVITSCLQVGITAILGMSAPFSCIAHKREMISFLDGVLKKS